MQFICTWYKCSSAAACPKRMTLVVPFGFGVTVSQESSLEFKFAYMFWYYVFGTLELKKLQIILKTNPSD